MANDLAALDRLFAPGLDTLRGDAGGLLIGHDAISEFRRGRGGAPQRTVLSVEVRPVSDSCALIVAVFMPASGGRGQQTQLWQRDASAWLVTAAHVSQPAPAINRAIWRVIGAPLVSGAASGPLSKHVSSELPLAGETVAVKDLFAVAGFALGGGVPAYLAEQHPASTTAPAVQALLDAGADVQGIAQTDEFAYSIAGRNPHYGTPPNPAVVGGIPGGSSSGPASAVAAGQASIGLGTDTGGSIRVPASYQGLWGLRTTHGAVDASGLLPLSPSFDTIGWLTRRPETLAAAAAATLDRTTQRSVEHAFVVSPALTAQAELAVGDAFESSIPDATQVDFGDLGELVEIFRTIQAAEAWATHGDWVSAHPGALGADIAARFEWAAKVTPAQEAAARGARSAARAQIESVLDGRILLLPSTSSSAPSATAPAEVIEATRAATLRLTCIAGILGAPAVSAPFLSVGGAPVGLCLVGPRFSDLALIEAAQVLSDRPGLLA
jgi:amidase